MSCCLQPRPHAALARLCDTTPEALAEAARAARPYTPASWQPLRRFIGDRQTDTLDVDVCRDDPLDEITGPARPGALNALPAYYQARYEHTLAKLLARRPVIELAREAAAALPSPFGLCVLDAWRPLELQAHLAQDVAAVADGFVAPPDPDPSRPPAHLTGATLDITLSFPWKGRHVPLGLGTSFDAFCPCAHTTAPLDEDVQTLRRLLTANLASVGFVTYAREWWHVEHRTRRWAATTGRDACYGAAAPDVPGARQR